MNRNLIFACALAAGAAAAQPAAVPLWEVGGLAFGTHQQAYPGSDQSVRRAIALPYLLYRGEVLRIDRGTAGVRALKRPTFEVDIGFSGAFGSSSRDIDARRGMPDLGTLVEFGPRLKWNLGEAAGGRWHVELPLRGVFDLGDRLARRGLSFEPELQFARRTTGGLSYAASVAAVIGDRRLAETFYGVEPAYATAERPAYDARAGLINGRLGLTASQQVAPDWRVFGFVRIDSVAGAANRASPLVRQTTGTTAGVGLNWTWMRSERAAVD